MDAVIVVGCVFKSSRIHCINLVLILMDVIKVVQRLSDGLFGSLHTH